MFAERVLARLFTEGRFVRADRALATAIVQETLRRRAALDYRLDAMLAERLDELPLPVVNALRIGLVQLLHLDRVPPHAAVNDSVTLCRITGHVEQVGVVNAILRRAASGDLPPLPDGDDDESIAVRHSLPLWLVTRWRRYGDRFYEVVAGANRIPDLVLRVDRRRTSVEAVLAALATKGVDATPGHLSADSVRVLGRLTLEDLGPFREGLASVQDEAESLVVELVDPLPTHRVLDLCAAPGGKSLHVLERTGGAVELIAVEKEFTRLSRLRENRSRLGMAFDVVCADGRELPFDVAFDRVLVDAPCTGTGVLARRADSRWRLGVDDPRKSRDLQLELLASGADRVALGGLLVYAVCSIEPEETTDVVERFTGHNRRFREEPADTLPAPARDAEGRLHLLPGQYGSDGVFAARFRRIE